MKKKDEDESGEEEIQERKKERERNDYHHEGKDYERNSVMNNSKGIKATRLEDHLRRLGLFRK